MSEKQETTADEECDVARVQTRNTLTSWYNERNEAIARMKKEGKIAPEWVEKYETVLNSVKTQIDSIDETLGSGCRVGVKKEDKAATT